MGTKSSLHVQIRGWSMLTCWQVAWDDDLPVSFLSKIGCINLPRSGLALSHAPFTFSIPTGARSFTMLYQVISVHTLGPLQSLRPNHAAKRLRPSASSRFPSGTPLSPDPRARCLKTADTRTDTVEYLRYILELSWFDQHVHCRLWQVSLILRIGSRVSKKSPPRKCQRQGWTPKLPASTKTCYFDGDRDTSKIPALANQGYFEDGNET